MFSSSRALRGALTLLVVGASVACSDADTRADDGRVRIEASFYPLAWAAERVGGAEVSVRSLTKAGAEPHDLELTPSDVARVLDADLVVYLEGFQPAVDDAVDDADPDSRFDAGVPARLDLTFTPIDDDHGHEGESESEHDDEGEGAEEDGGAIVDPHFWLDPTRLAAVAEALGDRLATVDPAHAGSYRDNAARLVRELEALDETFSAGLASCASRDLVTTHNAFGYLAARYDLTQIGITGLSPEQEPSPADLATVTRYVQEHQVGTIFFETLVGPGLARVVARETGSATAVLDPLEGLTESSEGRDYLEVMASNLANLRAGLGCT